MKHLFVGAAILSMLCVAGGAGAQNEKGGAQSDFPKEQAIRKLYADFEQAWNKHDAKAMSARWAIDGDHGEPDGRIAKGRSEVEKLFKEEHETVFKGTVLKLTIVGVWFISAEVALVEGTYELSGVLGAEGKPIPARTGHLTSVLLLEGGQWSVSASRLMIPVPLVWRKM